MPVPFGRHPTLDVPTLLPARFGFAPVKTSPVPLEQISLSIAVIALPSARTPAVSFGNAVRRSALIPMVLAVSEHEFACTSTAVSKPPIESRVRLEPSLPGAKRSPVATVDDAVTVTVFGKKGPARPRGLTLPGAPTARLSSAHHRPESRTGCYPARPSGSPP